jgi:hypothetical protein
MVVLEEVVVYLLVGVVIPRHQQVFLKKEVFQKND